MTSDDGPPTSGTARAGPPDATLSGSPDVDLPPVPTAQLIIDIASAAAGERDLDQILHEALDRLRTVVPLTGGSIALVERNELVIRAAIGPFAGEALGQRLPRGPNRSWRIVESMRPFLTGDTVAEGVRIRGAQARTSIRSWLAVPIVRRGTGIGLVEIDSTEPHAFGSADVDLLTTIVGVLAGPVELAGIHAEERRAAALREAFIGVISHELRTPITTIYGLSKTLRQRDASLAPEVRSRAIEDIEAEADRLYRLVEDLLILSRAEGGRVDMDGEPISVARILRRTVDAEARRLVGRSVHLDLPVDALPLVIGEETFLEQVVRNLLTNAAKYSPAGAPIRVTALTLDGELRVEVHDDGIGMSDEEAIRAFDLFYRSSTAARTAPGAGIGLFVCRQLIEAMGGRIGAMPRDGGGTCVWFSLPARPIDEADPE